MSNYKNKIIDLNGNRKLQNALKKAGLHLFHPKGEWNGYGCPDLPLVVEITSSYEMRIYNKAKKEIDEISSNAKPPLTEEEKIEKWARRLIKFIDISLEDAIDIANEKLKYQQDRIDELNKRQCEYYSVRREKLINKIIRENPLRRIIDEDHARAILAASERHNHSDYEEMLKVAREKADIGEIEYDEIKEWAREHCTYSQRTKDMYIDLQPSQISE